MTNNRRNPGSQGLLTRSFAGYSIGSLLMALCALAVMITTLAIGR